MKLLFLINASKEMENITKEIGKSKGFQVIFENDNESWEDIEVVLTFVPALKNIGSYINRLPNLKFIQTLSAGVDLIDFSQIPENIMVCSNAGAFAKPVAEHAVAMAMALSKNLMANHSKMKNGVFDQSSHSMRLEGKLAGIIGYGGIGKDIGKLCKAIGMELAVISRSPVEEQGVKYSGSLDSLDRVLQESDILFVSIPLNTYTENLITSKELDKMKADAILVNVARADIINQKDLYEHLISYPQFKAGIDVWWKEPINAGKFETGFGFLDLPNVIGSPHNSAMVPEIENNAFLTALNNVELWMKGGVPKNRVQRKDY